MSKMKTRIMSVLLAVVMTLSLAPFGVLSDFAKSALPVAAAKDYAVGDIIEFGGYPQTLVTDAATVAALNNEVAQTAWKSYRYYSGDGRYGSYVVGDWMRYADFMYNGSKYRAVTFDTYRPDYTRFQSQTAGSRTYHQDVNSYVCGNVYFFEWEPLKWRVLDPSSGLVMSENLIDSQSYSNTIYGNPKGYTNDAEGDNFANDYVTSSIRDWLLHDFYYSAFSYAEQALIKITQLDNSAYSRWTNSCPQYDSASTTDKIFLLSNAEIRNTTYGFSQYNADTARSAQGTDYAKCQGLYVYDSGVSYWWLRSPGSMNYSACDINHAGFIDSRNDVDGTFKGVRPAFQFKSGISESSNPNGGSGIPVSGNPNEYCVMAVDTNGMPIEGAEVTWDCSYGGYNDLEKKQTNNEGYALFTCRTAGQPTITIEKDGYLPYTTAGTNYKKSAEGYDVFTLYSEADGGLRLKSAYYANDGSGQRHNLLTQTKKISAEEKNTYDLDDGKFDLYCKAVDESVVERYTVWQGAKQIAESVSGEFKKLNVDSFSPGGEIYIGVHSGQKCVKTKINLEISDPNPGNAAFNLEFGKKVKWSVPDNIPYVGGSELSVDIPDLPVEVKFDYADGKTTVYLGVNLDRGHVDTQGNTNEKKSMKEQASDIKKLMSDLKRIGRSNLDNHDSVKTMVNEYLKSKKQLDLPVIGSVDGTFIGYGEGVLDNNGIAKVTLDLYVMVEIEFNKTWQTVVWVIPVVIDMSIKCSVGADGNFVYEVKEQTFTGDLKLKGSIGLEAFGGVGVGKLVGVGATGSAECSVEYQLMGTTRTPGLNSVDLDGKLGIKAYAGPFTYEKAFAHHTWNLYTRNTGKSAAPAKRYDSDLYDAENWTLDDLSYLGEQGVWNGGNASGGPRKASALATNQLRILQENAYRNASPVIASNGDTAVMLFVGADTTRSAVNAPVVKYSVFDGASWSEPRKLDDNDTADATPYVYCDGADLWAIYADTALVLPEDAELEDYIENQSLTVMRFDPATQSFADGTVLSEPGYFNSVPELAVAGGQLIAIWQRNAAADLFGANGDNALMRSVFDGEEWSAPETLEENMNSIVGMAAGVLDDNICVAYITDGDNDLATTDDRSLFVKAGENTFCFASGTLSNPTFSGNGLYWYGDGALYKTEELVEPTLVSYELNGFTDKYLIDGERVAYLAADSDSSQIFTAFLRDDGAIGGVPLTAQSGYIDCLSGAMVAGNEIFVMSIKNVTVTEDAVDDDCTLAWMTAGEQSEITIEAVDFDQALVAEDAELPVNVVITNRGTAAIESVRVTITGEDGTVICNDERKIAILSGKTAMVETEAVFNEAVTKQAYSVCVIATDENGEYTQDEQTVTLGYADIDVSAELISIGESRSVAVNVVNNGASANSGTLEMYIGDAQTPAQSFDLGELQTGDRFIRLIPITEELLGGTANTIVFKAVTAEEEYYTKNNENTFFVDLMHGRHTEHTWDGGVVTTAATTTATGVKTYTCTVCGETKTEAIPKALAKIAVTAENVTTGIKLTWAQDANATGYYVYRKTASTSYKAIRKITSNTTLTYTDTSAEPGTKYTYCVKSYRGTERGTYTAKSITCLAPITPTLANGKTGMTLTWTKVAGADGYYVFRKTGSGSYTTLKKIVGADTLTYTDTTAVSGTKYTYAVRAYKSTTKGAYTAKSMTRLSAVKPTLTNIASGIYVKWTKVTGATGYYVYRKAGSGSYSLVKKITDTATVTFTDTAVKDKNGVKYTYIVKAYKGTTKSAYTAKATYRLTGVAISSVTNSAAGSMTVKWAQNAKATGYQIQYATNSKFTSAKTVTVSGASTLSKTIASLTKGSTYYVRVRAYKTVSSVKYYSAWSSAKSVKIVK
ncbi:MAG: fibronectin type III domain-containing protein [Clostridia bacterium]|nr:fibronectin type III domain-containing protein [Clostridia bacterium]